MKFFISSSQGWIHSIQRDSYTQNHIFLLHRQWGVGWQLSGTELSVELPQFKRSVFFDGIYMCRYCWSMIVVCNWCDLCCCCCLAHFQCCCCCCCCCLAQLQCKKMKKKINIKKNTSNTGHSGRRQRGWERRWRGRWRLRVVGQGEEAERDQAQHH